MADNHIKSILKGSCLCREVEYEIKGGVGNISLCHCSMCQKAHGAPFGTYASVAWDAFSFTKGANLVREFRSSEDVTRTFCSVCGSNLQFIGSNKLGFGLAVGSLDSDPTRRPTEQIWVKDKAVWWNLHDEPPFFQTYPPKRRNNL